MPGRWEDVLAIREREDASVEVTSSRKGPRRGDEPKITISGIFLGSYPPALPTPASSSVLVAARSSSGLEE